MIHAKKMVIRTSKQDSAFLYYILEANEGLTAYSTVDYKVHDKVRHAIRDVELMIPPERVGEVKELLKELSFVTIISDSTHL
jgi:DUF438 domain-containing protein